MSFATDILDAMAGARMRGHKFMGYRTTAKSEAGRTYYDYTCEKCGMEVRITPQPMPNETFASGKALALNCKEA